MVDFYGISDVGLHRKKNEDSYMASFNLDGDFLALVCDGIGGAKAGDIASKMVADYFLEEFKNSCSFDSLNSAIDYLNKHIEKINKQVFDLSINNEEYFGMGTTLSGILITEHGTLSINVGDSRTYGVIDKKLFRLTSDHTLVNQMLERGEITYDESLNHPKRHYLVKAIGVFENIKCDIHRVKDMDYFLICSDGLCGYVSDEEIIRIMNSYEYNSCEDKARALLDFSLLKGGYDNITVIIVKH